MGEPEESVSELIAAMEAFAGDFVFFREQVRQNLAKSMNIALKDVVFPEEHMVMLFDSFKKDQRTEAINENRGPKANASASTAQIDYIRSLYAKKEGGEDRVAGFLKAAEKEALTEKDASGKDTKILLSSKEAHQLIEELKGLPDRPRPGRRGY